jgi:predicted RND superfamily exporter protein
MTYDDGTPPRAPQRRASSSDGLLERWYRSLVGHRVSWLGVCLLIPAALAFYVPTEFDSSLRIWFLDDDPDVAAYDAFLDRFESDEFIAIGVEGDVYTPEFVADLERLTEALEPIDGVLSVTSLANVDTVELVGETLVTRPLIAEIPTDAVDWAALQRRVEGDRLLRDLVSDDARASLVMVEVAHFEDIDRKVELVRDVRRAGVEQMPTRTLHLAGNPVIDEAFLVGSIEDLMIFAPLTMLVVVIAIFLLFRSVWATLVPAAVVGLTLVTTLGIAGALGYQLNLITNIIIPLTMAVGVADCIHLISGYRERLKRGLARPEALKTAWRELFLPCLITTLTTAAGLGSLLVASLEPLRQFAWMGALAVLLAIIYTLVLVPVAFSFLPPPPTGHLQQKRLFTRLLVGIADLSWHRHRWVLGGAFAVALFAAAGLPRLDVGADFQRYFGSDDPIHIDADFIDNRLGGTGSVEVLVEAPDIREPRVLRQLERVETYFADKDATTWTLSPASIVKLLHERYFGDPDRYRLPDTLPRTAQLLEMVRGTDLFESHITAGNHLGRLTVRVRATQYKSIIDDMEEAEAVVADTFTDGTTARITGIGKLVANLDNYILRSQVRSFLLAFVVIGLMICLLFRSLRMGLWALVPNALPLLLVIGTMGWLGILLDVATVMVASILLGLIVDDTVHFLARFRLEEREALRSGSREPVRRALFLTGTGTGRALLTTTVVLTCAFWTLFFSNFEPNRAFGIVTGAAIAVALVFDLVVLPSVIRWLPLERLARRSRSQISDLRSPSSALGSRFSDLEPPSASRDLPA